VFVVAIEFAVRVVWGTTCEERSSDVQATSTRDIIVERWQTRSSYATDGVSTLVVGIDEQNVPQTAD
jgi:hypothetical protein